ncbi:MAG: Rieske (2Fe-2S) protein [Acidobacteria bacterium]|nr:Rieske (2Fe-2S) protein [Acidobacteriota bacterium]
MTDCNNKSTCINRREFLVKTGLVAGGAVLTISALGRRVAGMAFEDVTEVIDTASPLAKVGGSKIIQSAAGPIIVIRLDKAKFAAFSAKCTHKGALVAYNSDSQQIECPKHGSKFDGTTGDVTHGPADEPLPKYAAAGGDTQVVVTVGT